MDFANRGNRPNETPAGGQPAPSFSKKSSGKKGFSLGSATQIIALVAVVILVASVIAGMIFIKGNSETDLIDTSKYQAVFLDSADGQVYFGNLAVYNEDLYELTDIYYVRVENPIQPEGTNQQAQPNISLAKLGNELHGPEDVMYIHRDKVLYWENLKTDGQVTEAIVDFKANGEQAPAQQQQQTQPAGTPQQNDTPAEAPAETPEQ